MAASFQTGGSSAAPRDTQPKKANKVPNVRLSFITAQDQAKFETLFKSAVGDDATLSGDKARDLLMRSRLDGDSLSHIWQVAWRCASIGVSLANAFYSPGLSLILLGPDNCTFPSLPSPCICAT